MKNLMYKMQSIFDIAMVLLLIFFLLNLGGCATIGDYCEEKPEVCATAGAAAVFVGTVAIVHAAQPKGVVVKQNAPSAPITISPYCPTCTT